MRSGLGVHYPCADIANKNIRKHFLVEQVVHRQGWQMSATGRTCYSEMFSGALKIAKR